MADVRTDADRVLKITAELRDLRGRLAELDSERAAVELQIQNKLGELGVASGELGVEPRGTSDRILAYMRRYPGKVFTATGLAREWNEPSEVGNFRAALRRLSKRQKIERIRVGKYRVRTAP
jgi:hypothetical protein